MSDSWKGIVLAGGAGTRLQPLTKGISKQLLPIFDKPMIYYSLSVLLLAGIRKILVITTPEDAAQYRRVLGDGADFGVELTYATQSEPEGVAQALIVGEGFIDNSNVALILGDNFFFGQGLTDKLKAAKRCNGGATVFGFRVADPARFGVIDLGLHGKVEGIVEKPTKPVSNLVATGLYFYDSRAVEFAKNLKPSRRGELEITDLNLEYLRIGALKCQELGRGFTWLDAGTHTSLMEAGQFVQIVQERQGLMIGCLHEIAFKEGWVSQSDIQRQALAMGDSPYKRYIQALVSC